MTPPQAFGAFHVCVCVNIIPPSPRSCQSLLISILSSPTHTHIYTHSTSEMIKLKYGGTNEGAARVASLAQVLPIFVAPFMGWWHEKYGRRSLIRKSCSLSLSLGGIEGAFHKSGRDVSELTLPILPFFHQPRSWHC